MESIWSQSNYRVGEITYQSPCIYGPREQTNLQLVYVHEGNLSVYVDSAEYRLCTNDAILLFPGHTERFHFAEDGPTHHGWCDLINANLNADALENLKQYRSINRLSSQMKAIARFIHTPDSLTSTLCKDPTNRLLAQSLFQAYFDEFEKPTANHPLPTPVIRACSHARNHLGEALTLDDLASAAGVSGSHLVRLFQTHLQSTPFNWLWHLRLERAQQLLVETALSISEIAYRIGFQTPYHFSRRFKAQYGDSPVNYRKKIWGKP
ncbi:AraC family transcriptional regulator [Rubellicoccus peritrichatus]|uniref:AraC family transcriptional regulator n=1 Tax=Rubellicoccus peritrichatus TaxID=3080537 RepID=A0AAQ3LC78_9BACT|nr:AraC family transcriptional regulator [Puniceicoccus sp. CR14]WOO43439.1 AraC family transcriptional regulator [Puniceicoccus sp. CR14]